MSLFGFLGEVVDATIKITVTPLTIASDIIGEVTDGDTDLTKKNIASISDNIDKAVDEIVP